MIGLKNIFFHFDLMFDCLLMEIFVEVNCTNMSLNFVFRLEDIQLVVEESGQIPLQAKNHSS